MEIRANTDYPTPEPQRIAAEKIRPIASELGAELSPILQKMYTTKRGDTHTFTPQEINTIKQYANEHPQERNTITHLLATYAQERLGVPCYELHDEGEGTYYLPTTFRDPFFTQDIPESSQYSFFLNASEDDFITWAKEGEKAEDTPDYYQNIGIRILSDEYAQEEKNRYRSIKAKQEEEERDDPREMLTPEALQQIHDEESAQPSIRTCLAAEARPGVKSLVSEYADHILIIHMDEHTKAYYAERFISACLRDQYELISIHEDGTIHRAYVGDGEYPSPTSYIIASLSLKRPQPEQEEMTTDDDHDMGNGYWSDEETDLLTDDEYSSEEEIKLGEKEKEKLDAVIAAHPQITAFDYQDAPYQIKLVTPDSGGDEDGIVIFDAKRVDISDPAIRYMIQASLDMAICSGDISVVYNDGSIHFYSSLEEIPEDTSTISSIITSTSHA